LMTKVRFQIDIPGFLLKPNLWQRLSFLNNYILGMMILPYKNHSFKLLFHLNQI
jgi:hypothetical protein